MKPQINSAKILFCITTIALPALTPALHAADKLKALIVDGQNAFHPVWPKSTVMMKQYLEASGLFEVDVARTKFIWNAEREKAFLPLAGAGESEMVKEPQPDPNFKPDFAKYAVVISNFGWRAADWPEQTQRAFENYVAGGGGFVSVHAADNSWGKWTEFNKMIALGGWGDRNEKDGPYVYYNNDGKIVRDTSPGSAGKHAPANEFVVTIRNHEHPITKGLPDFWAHTKDECYSHLRGPAENLTILATASDSPELKAAGRHEPMLMTVDYHKGRVFHTTLGHDTEAFEGVGFITTFLRGTEWAATGKVTQTIPADFPSADKSSARPFQLANQQACGPRDVMTQISTYDALAAGLYDGVAPLSLASGRGDLGLGTLHGWNGELILLDGKYWLVDGYGAVSRITDMTATTPFLAVTHFDEDVRRPLPNGTTFADLKKSPADYVPGVNVIYAIKLEGTFRHVKVRSMPIQSKPYKFMAELVKTQPTFEFNEVAGTMIGFWSPAAMQGIGLAGWHLHFLTKDEHGGGHVLEFTAGDAVLKLDETLEMDWHISGLPDYKNAPLGAKP